MIINIFYQYYRKRLLISAWFSHAYTLYTSEVYTWEKHALISKRLRYLYIIESIHPILHEM